MLRAPFRVRRLQKRTEAQWDMRPWLRADGGANESMSLQLGIRDPLSAQHDPSIDGGAYCPDALYVIDDLVGNGRRVGRRQDRLGIREADVIVAAARHEIAGRDRIDFGCIERRIADLDR